MKAPLGLAAPGHAIFVHFTVALTSSSAAFDLAGVLFDVPSLGEAGWWCLAGAALSTLPAVASGLIARMRLPMEEGEARAFLRTHMALGPLFMGCLLAVATWRAAIREAGAAPSAVYLAACGALVVLLTVQGYLGGELVYRYGADVRGAYPRLSGGTAAARSPAPDAPAPGHGPGGS